MNTKILVVSFVVVLLAAAYGIGRYTAPIQEKVVEVEVEKEVVVENSENTESLEQTIAQLREELQTVSRRNNINRKVVVVKTPDGTVTSTTTETDTSTTNTTTDTTTSTNTDTSKETKETETRTVIKEVVKLKLVEKKLVLPEWSVALAAGYHLPGLWGEDLPLNLVPVNNLVARVAVERRVWKSVWAGVWANSSGAIGIQMRLEL